MNVYTCAGKFKFQNVLNCIIANVKFLISTRFVDFVTVHDNLERNAPTYVNSIAPLRRARIRILYQRTYRMLKTQQLWREPETVQQLRTYNLKKLSDCWIFKIKLRNKFIRKVTYSNDMSTIVFALAESFSDTIVIINNREMSPRLPFLAPRCRKKNKTEKQIRRNSISWLALGIASKISQTSKEFFRWRVDTFFEDKVNRGKGTGTALQDTSASRASAAKGCK